MTHEPVLRGIKVVDFGHYVAGPVAGMLLADYGAEVIKVDPPSGPVYASPANAMWNRGKRSITLDLKSEADRKIAYDLIVGADIVIENFRPGVMDRWGLGEAAVRAANPGLIYASMPGFAAADPRADLQAWEGVVFAALDAYRPKTAYQNLGVQSSTHPDDRSHPPLPAVDRLASIYAAILCSNCIAAALIVKERSGLGQRIEVPLFDALLQGIGLLASVSVPPLVHTNPTFTPLELQYECADGRSFHLICSIVGHAEKLLNALGKADFIARGLGRPDILGKADDYAELHAFMAKTFGERTAAEWEAFFHEQQLPGAICRTIEEFVASPLARDGDLLVPNALGLLQPNTPVLLSGHRALCPPVAPAPDADRDAILAEVEAAKARSSVVAVKPSEMLAKPLDGVRVLDLCVILAGPVSGRTLAEFGADVIKIDDPVRGANAFHEDVNRGKQSVFLNLRDTDDRAVFWELVEQADVIVQNFRLGVLDKYGISAEAVRARNPRAIWVASNAYGDVGPWAHLPGYEGSVQAATGLEIRYSGHQGPSSFPFAVHDYATGYLSGLGVLLALLDRARGGQPREVHTALARTASLLQSEAWMAALAEKPAAAPSGPFEGVFACRKGWVYLAVKDRAAFNDRFAVGPGEDLGEFLTAYCAGRDKDEVVSALVSQGFSGHVLAWLGDVMRSPELQSRGLSVLRHNFRGGVKCYAAPPSWMSMSRIDMGRAAQTPGKGRARFRD